jgi:hypothetical protein
MLDLPQPGLTVGGIVDREVPPDVLASYLGCIAGHIAWPGPQLYGQSIGFGSIADCRSLIMAT